MAYTRMNFLHGRARTSLTLSRPSFFSLLERKSRFFLLEVKKSWEAGTAEYEDEYEDSR